MVIEFSDDERKFLQACFNDSASEGHFDHLFTELDFEAIRESLVQKKVLTVEEWQT